MIKNFLKKNWMYIALLFFIVGLNVASRQKIQEKPDSEVKVVPVAEKTENLFMNFEEARHKSKEIECVLKDNLPLYLFYMSANAFVVCVFLLGLAVDGYFISRKIKKKPIFRKIHGVRPPAWTIGEVFKITILGFSFAYLFFIVFSFAVTFFEGAAETKLTFYENENFKMIFDTIILDCAIFIAILWFLRTVHRKKLASIGFVKEGLRRNIFYGVSGYAGIIPVIIVIGVSVYILLNILKLTPPPQPIVELFLGEKNVPFMLISGFIAAVLGPAIEEIFFRGVMYNAVKRKIGIFWAIFITSILFSFLHVHALEYFLVGFIPIAILGAALAYLYEKTGSLIPSITLHVLNNVGSVFMVFLFKYFNSLVT